MLDPFGFKKKNLFLDFLYNILLALTNEFYAFLPICEQLMQNIFAIYYKVNEYDLLSISADAISDHPKKACSKSTI